MKCNKLAHYKQKKHEQSDLYLKKIIFVIKIKNMKKLLYIPIFFFLTIVGCDGESQTIKKLKAIDSMEEKGFFDSAYQLIKKIDIKEIKTDGEKALYNMLYTKYSTITERLLPNTSMIDFSIQHYEKVNDIQNLAKAYFYKSTILYDNKDIQNSILFMKKAEQAAKEAKDQSILITSLLNLSFLNTETGAHKKGLEYGYMALKESEKEKKRRLRAACMTTWQLVSTILA